MYNFFKLFLLTVDIVKSIKKYKKHQMFYLTGNFIQCIEKQ